MNEFYDDMELTANYCKLTANLAEEIKTAVRANLRWVNLRGANLPF